MKPEEIKTQTDTDANRNCSRSGVRRDLSPIDQALAAIREALVGLQFGEVTVVLQDGVVVQLERTERKRLRKGHR